MRTILCAAAAAALLTLAPRAIQAASLLNTTVDANISLQGLDDNGFYTLAVFTGPINIASGYSNTFDFFRQNTYGGFSTASNQLTGAVGLSITGDSITLTFNGQAQPVELIGIFTNLPPVITSATETASGFLPGVAMPLPSSFTDTSLTISAFYFGFQPGTSTSQTDVLTFGAPVPPPAVPEPSTFVLAGSCLLGLFGLARRKMHRQG